MTKGKVLYSADFTPVGSPCPECEGKGFKEYQAGLIQIGCETCSGTGKTGGVNKFPSWKDIENDGFEALRDIPKDFAEHVKAQRKITEAINDSDSGARPTDTDIGGPDTSKPKRTSKPKKKKKPGKRAK